MEDRKSVLARVLDEVKAAGSADATTTSHNSYVSGVFEDTKGQDANAVLARVLDEVKAAESADATTTSHNSYVSGVFEDTN